MHRFSTAGFGYCHCNAFNGFSCRIGNRDNRAHGIRDLELLPDYVVGIRASGQVDAKDYETVLIPAVDLALQKHKRIRELYQLAPDFEGFTAGAMWDDSKLGVAHLKAWERIVVVTDVHWVANATQMFAFLMPGLVKVFSNEAQSDAEK